jgi:AhpD family alkylhydroperoxidase
MGLRITDMSGNSPFAAHSPDPELLAGLWSVIYEALLVDGNLRRADKEAIAASVSQINQCPFCVDVHSVAAGMAGEADDRGALHRGAPGEILDRRRREFAEWAGATRDPRSELVRHPPFSSDEAPEAIGTAVCFHYVNRIVTIFHGEDGVDLGPRWLRPMVLPLVSRAVGRSVRRDREPGRWGDSLRPELPPDLAWAQDSTSIASAYARFANVLDHAGEASLSSEERDFVEGWVESWTGEDMTTNADWLDSALARLDPSAVPGARLASLAALAPHRIDETVVEDYCSRRPGDATVLGAVAWAAFRAARQIGSWLYPRHSEATPAGSATARRR